MDLNLSPAITPAIIASAHKMLSIPIYQRLFVWGESQIDTLLSDLWGSRTRNDYYLGVITVYENDSQQWEIVDGQQRLTFLTLLGCLLKKMECDHSDNWGGFIFTGDERKEPRLFFHGRPEDRKDILKFVNRSSSDFVNFAFARFAERFSLFANGKSKEELSEFSEYCFQHAAFLVNELPKTYGPDELNLYFERMNSTGRQLTPLEVVKGKWFSPYAARWNACMNFDERFVAQSGNSETNGICGHDVTLRDVLNGNTAAVDLGATTSDVMPSKCRLVMRDDVLALHALRLCYGDEVSLDRDKLISTFTFFSGKAPSFSNEVIEKLENYRKWIDDNIIYLKDDDGKYKYAFRSDKPDNEDEDISDFEKLQMRQLQSMLYVSSGEKQEWVLEAYKKQNATIQGLEEADNKRHGLPIINGCLDANAFSYHAHNRYWFFKLDYILWKYRGKWTTMTPDKQQWKTAIDRFVFRPNRSIEHLHPQAPQAETWLKGNLKDDDIKSIRDSFGNLALIPSSSNSFFSNLPLNEKFARVQRLLNQGHGLDSLKMTLMGISANFDDLQWGAEKASKHGKAMLDLLKAEYDKTVDSFDWNAIQIQASNPENAK